MTVKDSPVPAWPLCWQKADQYPAAQAMRYDWRWEFLRRNPKYQAKWKELIAPIYDFTDHSIGDGAPLGFFRDTFGLCLPAPPFWPGPIDMWTSDAVRGRDGNSDEVVFQLQRNESALVFDLTRPLNDQLDRARGMLEARQKHLMAEPFVSRGHRDKWPLYLRVLDARAAGAKPKDILAVLYPDLEYPDKSDGPKKDLRAAQRLRDGGYRHIRPAG